MRKILRFLLAGAVAFLMASCASTKDFVYLQDLEPGVDYPVKQKYEAKVQKDDRLRITVTSKNPELAIPFNQQNFTVGSDGVVGGSTLGSVHESGYRVDVEGDIDFPILGKLRVEGLKVSEVTELIRERIIDGGYIKNPLVSLEFLNFRYTVLGAVAQNGTFTVDGDKVTLLEAIAKAGDLTTSARVDKVGVIREEDGNRKLYVHDLRSRDIFESPCFYLNQNDVIIVERKYLKTDNEDRAWRVATTISTILATASSVIWALTLLSKD